MYYIPEAFTQKSSLQLQSLCHLPGPFVSSMMFEMKNSACVYKDDGKARIEGNDLEATMSSCLIKDFTSTREVMKVGHME